MDNELQTAIRIMAQRIADILAPCAPSIYLYGSCVLDDFRPGWSDIDLLVLTQTPLSQAQADRLVGLRQAIPEAAPYSRAFEGAMLPLDAFLSGQPTRVVYWGTSGQRITDRYSFDAFCMTQLLDSGLLLFGTDVRDRLRRPSFDDLKTAVGRHLEAIRKYAQRTERSLYSYGWLLDIARCIYTLRTGEIIPKTRAAAWALEQQLCPDPPVLTAALKIRRSPLQYREDPETFNDAETLGEPIQRFADVLENELRGQPCRK